MFDFLDSDWLGDFSDYASDAADSIKPGDLGSGMFGAIGDSVKDFGLGAAQGDPSYLEFVTNPDLAAALEGFSADAFSGASSGSDGITGIGWIDKVLGRIGESWEKDPLSTIGAGIGILGKIDAIRKAQGHRPWVGNGGGEAGTAEAAAKIAAMDEMMGGVRNAGSAAFNSMANRIPSNTVIPMPHPVGLDPSVYMPNGALSQIKR